MLNSKSWGKCFPFYFPGNTFFSYTLKKKWKHSNSLASSLRGRWNMAPLGTIYDFISKVYSVRAMNHDTHEINHLNGRMLRPKIPHEAYTGERSVKNSLWDLHFISLNSWKTIKNWLPISENKAKRVSGRQRRREMSNKEEVGKGKMTGVNEEKVIQQCSWTQEEKSRTNCQSTRPYMRLLMHLSYCLI